MTVEEKARAYDEAKSIMEKYLKSGNAGVIAENSIKKAFPELKDNKEENADEKIRKALIKLVTNHASMDLFIEYDIHLDEALTWLEKQAFNANKGYWRGYREGKQEILDKYAKLEKQGEQKSAFEMKTPEKSLGIDSDTYSKIIDECVYGEQKTVDEIAKEVCKDKASAVDFLKSAGIMNEKGELAEQYREDEQNLNAWTEDDEKQARQIERIVSNDGCTQKLQKQISDWFKSLKDKILLQPKQEWSEEDEKMRAAVLQLITDSEKENSWNCVYCNDKEIYFSDIIAWLNFLRLKSQWKPSEEQLKSLQEVIDAGHYTSYPYALETLYEQIKKLKKE